MATQPDRDRLVVVSSTLDLKVQPSAPMNLEPLLGSVGKCRTVPVQMARQVDGDRAVARPANRIFRDSRTGRESADVYIAVVENRIEDIGGSMEGAVKRNTSPPSGPPYPTLSWQPAPVSVETNC